MRFWPALLIVLIVALLTSGCVETPAPDQGVSPTAAPATGPPTPAVISGACEEYTSSTRAVFVSRPTEDGLDILFTYEDGFDDLALDHLTIQVNNGPLWQTTEPWGVLGTGKGVKPSKGATFRVRGEATPRQDRVTITAWFTDGTEDVIRIACV